MKSKVIIVLLITLIVDETSLQQFTESNNEFAIAVYKELVKSGGEGSNILFSPLSVEIILALTQSGARGASGEEIRHGLHLPNDQNKIQLAIQELISVFHNQKDYVIKSANAIYIQDGFEIKDEFQDIAAKVFGSELQNIDFRDKEQAAHIMNQWVEDQTEDKIKDLFQGNSLQDNLVAILINALYLSANWSIPFDSQATTKKNFHNSDGNIVQVDTMHFTETLNYFDNQIISAKYLELAFKGDETLTMTFILPYHPDGLANLEKQFHSSLIHPNYTQEPVKVALPKFKIETDKIDLVPILKNLGITKIFDFNEADLSGIAGDKGDLAVSDVAQKAYIDVSETGVEAAAATSVVMGTRNAKPRPVNPKEFIAEHPFIFYIKLKGIVVFLGKVTKL